MAASTASSFANAGGAKALRLKKLANKSFTKLGSESKIKFTAVGGFENECDTRISQSYNTQNFAESKNLSCSFDTRTMECLSCCNTGGHPILLKESDAGKTEMMPQCFVICDQNFPAILPVDEEGQCIKIIRIEDCSLREVVDSFLAITTGFCLPAGSVVVQIGRAHV